MNRSATFNKCICNLTPEVRDILKILWKRGEIALSPPFHNILLPVIIFMFKQGPDYRFEISGYLR